VYFDEKGVGVLLPPPPPGAARSLGLLPSEQRRELPTWIGLAR
jgi:hypothetical protein